MNEKKYFINDRVIIPDDIKKMSKEELQKEIDKFEKEAKKNFRTYISKVYDENNNDILDQVYANKFRCEYRIRSYFYG